MTCLKIPRMNKTDPRSSSNRELHEDVLLWWHYFWVHKKNRFTAKGQLQTHLWKKAGYIWNRSSQRAARPGEQLNVGEKGETSAACDHSLSEGPSMPAQGMANIQNHQAKQCFQANNLFTSVNIMVTTRVFSHIASQNKHRPALIASCLLNHQASGRSRCFQACILH